ncbi:magnesium transporter [bacterium]|nr:magnesium transporter [bacterium]
MEQADFLIKQIAELIEKQDLHSANKLLEDLHSADIAYILQNLDSDEDKTFLFSLLNSEISSEVISELEGSTLDVILKGTSSEKLQNIVNELESDEAADLVAELDENKAEELLEAIPIETSSEIKELLRYKEDTAGSLMALEVFKVTEDKTISEAIEILRAVAADHEIDNFYNVFVVDEKNRLVGTLSLQKLLLTKPYEIIKNVMEEPVAFVETDVDQEEVANIVKKYNLASIPVVDSKMRVVGRITHDDITDVLIEEASEDISKLTGSDNEEMFEKSSFVISRIRLPWLIVGLLGETVSAFVLSRFINSLQEVVALTFFIPVIMATAGNCGIQASSIVIRGIATGEFAISSLTRQFWKELRVGLINGIVCGILILLIITVWLDYRFGLIVGLSLMLIMLIASIMGSIVPITLKRLNIDPAVAAGPFITTSNDIFGLFFYLALTTFFIKYFGIN